MPTRILLIRHGETDWNVQGRWQGHAPVPLNDQGRRQAALLAEALVQYPDRISAIYSSDLSRAFETASIIGNRLGLPVFPDVRLREIDLGDWQGLTYDEVRAWDGQRHDEIQQNSLEMPRPGGESPEQLASRCVDALHSIVQRHKDDVVLAVSHGGAIRHILRRLVGIQEVPEFIGNTSHAHLEFDHAKTVWSFEGFNQAKALDAVRTDGALKTGQEG